MSWLSNAIHHPSDVAKGLAKPSSRGDSGLGPNWGSRNGMNLGTGLERAFKSGWQQIKSKPLKVFHTDQLSNGIWNKAFGTHDVTPVNAFGSPSAYTWQKTQQDNPSVDLTRAKDFTKIGDAIAGYYGGSAATSALGVGAGSSPGAKAIGDAGSSFLNSVAASTDAAGAAGLVGAAGGAGRAFNPFARFGSGPGIGYGTGSNGANPFAGVAGSIPPSFFQNPQAMAALQQMLSQGAAPQGGPQEAPGTMSDTAPQEPHPAVAPPQWWGSDTRKSFGPEPDPATRMGTVGGFGNGGGTMGLQNRWVRAI